MASHLGKYLIEQGDVVEHVLRDVRLVMAKQKQEIPALPLLLSIPEVALSLRLSRAKVYELISGEGLPVVRFGGHIPLQKLAVSHVQALYAQKLNEGYKPRMIVLIHFGEETGLIGRTLLGYM